jgi:hypothetical protein
MKRLDEHCAQAVIDRTMTVQCTTRIPTRGSA